MTDQKPPSQDKESRQLEQEELEAIFRDWDASRVSPEPEEEAPESLERREQLEEIQRIYGRAQRAVAKRLILMLSMFAVAVITFIWNYSEIQFYFANKTDIADVRAQYIAANRPNATESAAFEPALQHNGWIAVQNLIPTEEYQSEDGHWHYFFDPMLKMIVVTPHPLPNKLSRTGAVGSQIFHVDPGLVGLVTGNGTHPWMYPEEAAMTGGFFSGEGRVFTAESAPRKYRAITNMYRQDLFLDTRLKDSQLWVFVDGEKPSDQWRFLIMYGIALLLILVSAVFFARARRKLRDVEREFTALQYQ